MTELDGGAAMLASGSVLAANDRLHGEIATLLGGGSGGGRRGVRA